MRILVLDANQRSALAVTRSLGASGITVFTADTTSEALAGCSRYSSGYLQCPSPADRPPEFLTWLRNAVAQYRMEWVFPVTEISSQLILHEPGALNGAQIPFAALATVMQLADKWALVQLAQRSGVPHPRTAHYSKGTELLPEAIDALTYPIVLKPTQSRRWLGNQWLNTSVHVAQSASELRSLLQQKIYLRDHPFMVQEFIPGHGAGIFALYDQGRPITFFAHRRLREKPPEGGVSVLSQSAPLDSELLAATRTLLDAASWHGVAMVEFRVTPNGQPYLMEVNTRFWGSLQLAIDSGVDFPSLLLQISTGRTPAPQPPYRVGQRLRWLLGDVDSLYLTLRNPSQGARHKLRRLCQFFMPGLHTRHEINRSNDFAPAWFELKAWLRALRG